MLRQLHPGTRICCYRCSLPGLAGFTAYRCERTDIAPIKSQLGAEELRIILKIVGLSNSYKAKGVNKTIWR